MTQIAPWQCFAGVIVQAGRVQNPHSKSAKVLKSWHSFRFTLFKGKKASSIDSSRRRQ
ncbi:MAG: hypothetical protein G5702_06370 [Serratia symbiotica]|nr:hypothetical protein [Serratia symbiotica]